MLHSTLRFEPLIPGLVGHDHQSALPPLEPTEGIFGVVVHEHLAATFHDELVGRSRPGRRGGAIHVDPGPAGGDEHHVALAGGDQGRGIAPSDQARIFERFERAVSANEISGLGLGLFISRQIVESHGGTLRVESEPGRGARFSFVLPGH